MDTAVASPVEDSLETGDPPQESGRIDAARLRVIRQIGQGGMATIHLADLAGEAGQPPRRVALKLMHAHLNEDPSLVRRFEHEVQSQAGLAHPCVVEMAGWGQGADGRLFMAMEYVDGPALRDLMVPGRRFPADIAAHVTRSMLAGLQAAHRRGLVHRDVKPANVMTTTDGCVKVADFGIAKAADMTKLTSTGSVIGTPAYMSPEQALARSIDPRSDLFSVGVVLYEMLVGANPFQTGNPATTLSRVVHHQQRPAFEALPQVPALLDDLLERLLQKEPGQRCPDAGEALALLDRCIEEDELCATQEAFAAYVAEPDVVARRLGSRRARRHFERGCRFYQGGRGNAEAATWEFFLATLLDPGDADARNWLEQVSRERGYQLQRKPHPRIDELEGQLKENPDSLPLVVQLAKLHKAQGNFLQVIYYYRRARSLRPPDNYTRQQIETLVSAQAASLLDGTGVFETRDHVPVRVRPAAPSPAEPERASGVADFLAGVMSTGWGKAVAACGLLAGFVVLCGLAFDRAAVASGSTGGPSSWAHEPELDRQVLMLETGREHAEAGRHAQAESAWRSFLGEFPSSGLASEVMFRLGESLERQGRRPEALDAHERNAADHLDDWALRSRAHRAEMLAVEGELASARREYEAITRLGDGEPRARAQLALANLAIREDRRSVAAAEFEALMTDARGTPAWDPARLDFADFLASEGDTARARVLYEDVRAGADHRGESFRRASAGLDVLAGGSASPDVAAAGPAPATPEEPASEPPADPWTAETVADPWAPAAPDAQSRAVAEPAAADAEANATQDAEAPATGLLTGLGGR